MRTMIEMARQAGFDITYDPTESPPQCFVEAWEDQLKAFADLVRADQREIDAKVADDSDHVVDGRGYYDQLGDANATARNIAAAIRNRSNT